MDIAPAVYHDLLRSAARRLTGHQRRLFQAEVAQALCHGSARQAERLFGWGRQAVALGQQEAAHGIRCQEDFAARGLKPWEQRDPQLARDIRDLAEPHTQADPQMKSALKYTRLTATALRQALIAEKGYRAEDLPKPRTLRRLLNRLGYRIRRVQKTKPLKKPKETDAIFANLHGQPEPGSDPQTADLSIDVKAKVHLGEYDRGGQTRSDSRGQTPQAWDHDPPPKKKGSRGAC
jgi:Rhodopirellula transposase DDE domain